MSAAGGLFACHRLCAGPLKTRRGKMLRRSPSKTPGRKAARSSCGRRKAAKNLPLTGMWPPNGASPGEKAGNFARNRISFVRQRFLKGSFSTFLTACNGAKYPIGRAFLAGDGFHAGVQVNAVRRALLQRPVQGGGRNAARQKPGPEGTQRCQGGPVKGNAVAAALGAGIQQKPGAAVRP